jgi:hypothetical protein
MRTRFLVATVLVVSACHIDAPFFVSGDGTDSGADDTPFDASPDGGPPASFTVSTTTVSLLEGTGTTISVVMTARPATNFNVSVQPDDPSKLSIMPQGVLFTPENWGTSVEITIDALEDSDVTDDTVQLTLTGDDQFTKHVQVDVDDNDLGILAATPNGTSIDEYSSAPVDVSLSVAPAGVVTIDIDSSNPAATDVDPSTLTFDVTNWDTPQTVTVYGMDDVNIVPDSSTIHLVAAGLATVPIPFTVADMDRFEFSGAGVSIHERANPHVFLFRMASAPATTITTDIYVSTDTAGSLDKSFVMFTPDDWDTFQTVTFTPLRDDNADDVPFNLILNEEGGSGYVSMLLNLVIDDTRYSGYTGPYTNAQFIDPDVLRAIPFSVTSDVAIEKLVFYVSSEISGTPMELALYADGTGQPGALLATTGPVASAYYVNKFPIPTQALLGGHTYWLAIMSDSSGAANIAATAASGNTQCTASVSFSAGAPAQFPAATCGAGQELQLYGIGY